MKLNNEVVLRMFLIVAFIGLTSQALAKEWSDIQKQVWQMEEAYWGCIEKGDIDCYLALVHDSVVAWPDGKKMPLDKTQTGLMVHRMIASNTMKSYELTPEEIMVLDDVAVVFCSFEMETKRGSRSSRVIHTWKKLGDGWKMIGGMSSVQLKPPEFPEQVPPVLKNAKMFTSKAVSDGSFDFIHLKANSFVIQWQSTWKQEEHAPEDPFQFLSTQCMGSTVYINGLGYGKGYCNSMTSGGDLVQGEMILDKVKMGRNIRQERINLVRGTGKLSGIKGYVDVTTIPLEAEGQNRFKQLVEARTYYTLEKR